eukprot:Sdes_comp9945_c0_seq1m1498
MKLVFPPSKPLLGCFLLLLHLVNLTKCQDSLLKNPPQLAPLEELHQPETPSFLMFVQTWPATFCISQKTCRFPLPTHLWTIHGLWPENEHGKYPVFCNRSVKFNSSQIENLLPALRIYWPDLKAASAEGDSFWKYEYEKHGSCALGFPFLATEKKFFTAALQMVQQYKMVDVLTAAEISPSPDAKYSLLDISASIYSAFHSIPTIWCTFKDSKQYLLQIGICFD